MSSRPNYIVVQTTPGHRNSNTGIHHDLPESYTNPPKLPQKAVNFIGSMGKVVYHRLAHGVPFYVPENIFQERLAICHTCPVFDIKNQVCKKCGCGAQRKLKLSAMQCPFDPPKWLNYNTPEIH